MDFDVDGSFCLSIYVECLEWLVLYGVSVLFVVGGIGEFFLFM